MNPKCTAIGLAVLSGMFGGCDSGPDKQYGAWIGDLKICAGTVAKMRQEQDRQTGLPAMRLTFTEDGAKQLEEVSREYVGKPLPVLVNGEQIMAPQLVEPLTEGEVWMTGVDRARLVDVVAYAARPC